MLSRKLSNHIVAGTGFVREAQNLLDADKKPVRVQDQKEDKEGEKAEGLRRGGLAELR